MNLQFRYNQVCKAIDNIIESDKEDSESELLRVLREDKKDLEIQIANRLKDKLDVIGD